MDVVQQNQSSKLCHRASSVQMIINHVTRPPSDHPLSTQTFQNSQLPTPTKNRSLSSQSKLNQRIAYWEEESKGFWHGLRMMRWMRHPGKSLHTFNLGFHTIQSQSSSRSPTNYHRRLRRRSTLIRGTAVIKYFVKPYATWLGLRGTKLQRFVNQGYAIFYWGSSTIICLVSHWKCIMDQI
ncbi:hypothetical protein PPACK8108_LOCUS10052 [Phakopsora pachyrhizi]|uniref:Uncharacterized protein n=1 Tax=Phakopsora pachyrhizi TaxID=170000 RepID=A0AAV0B0G3_PHAPC|nr:hypothetical protein PPACK8108_LOCUS10052 [Phakopsora pachyrhizi]